MSCKYCNDGIPVTMKNGKPHHPYSSDWLLDIWIECENVEQPEGKSAADEPRKDEG